MTLLLLFAANSPPRTSWGAANGAAHGTDVLIVVCMGPPSDARVLATEQVMDDSWEELELRGGAALLGGGGVVDGIIASGGPGMDFCGLGGTRLRENSQRCGPDSGWL